MLIIKKMDDSSNYCIYIKSQINTYFICYIFIEHVQKVSEAYQNGKESVFVNGKTYYLDRILEIYVYLLSDIYAYRIKETINCGRSRNSIIKEYLDKQAQNVTSECITVGYGENKSCGEIDIVENRDSKNIFVVHGHDEAAREKVARFIEHIGYTPIILQEQVDSGNTIIEKIARYTGNVGFAIVIYTPCVYC